MMHFQQVEDILTEEGFLGWYFKENTEQAAEWEKWMKANPSQQALVDEAISFLQQLPEESRPMAQERIEEKLVELRTSISELENIKQTAPVIPMLNSRSKWWNVAAAIVLLLAAGFIFMRFNQPKLKLETKYAELALNTLPDGSTMILNSNSNATISKNWDEGKDREVWLEGEAYFKVTKTAHKNRFIVHTGKLDVIVTGTQFNVMNRHNKTMVFLSEGSVLIHTADGKELAMNPGDYVQMSGNNLERRPVKEENVLAWKDNKIAFDNTPLAEAAELIGDHYGIKITLAGETVASKSLTGIMPNNKLEDILTAIQLAIDVKISRVDNNITISENK
jgi:transmembrane sensor